MQLAMRRALVVIVCGVVAVAGCVSQSTSEVNLHDELNWPGYRLLNDPCG